MRRQIALVVVVVALVGSAVGLGAIARTFHAAARITPERSGGWASTPARRYFEDGLDSLSRALEGLGAALNGPRGTTRLAFRAARASYKKVECLLEAFGPTLASQLNGPPPDEEEDRPNVALGAPAGFQIIESALFPGGAAPSRDSTRATIAAMQRAVREFRPLTSRIEIGEAAVLDAMRLEWARVSVLGLAGVDADLSGDAVVEAAEAAEGMAALARTAGGTPTTRIAWARIDSAARAAAAYLREQPRFEGLDRLAFIAGYATPAARAVAAARALLPRPARLRRLWRQEAATVFEPGAFDAQAYAPDYAPPPSAPVIALGRRLFHETRLSGPGTRSCAFCHDPARAFADGRATSSLLAPARSALRNTPTLLNAGYQPALFMDSRAGSLEAQVHAVLASPSEMGSSDEEAAARLRGDSSYRSGFRRAFQGRPDSLISGQSVRTAVAAYVRSLSAMNSRFDRAVRGDSGAMTAAERRGFTVFMGKARCGTCHFAPLFNGTLPPNFVASEPEIIGVPEDPNARSHRLDPDPGRAGFDAESAHRGAFKVPTLRNIAETAPYMHNGAFATLEEVVAFYDRGGGAGSGVRVPDQTLPARRLRLTGRERADLVGFLRALTDTGLNRLEGDTATSRGSVR